MESGETDPARSGDAEHRMDQVMQELGSPEDMGKGFQDIYRPNRFVDYLLVAVPYVLSLFFTAFYLQLRPQYPWMDIRLNAIMDFALILVGLRRRSPLLTLFWIHMAVMQLLYIVLQGVWQPYWYFGTQTILWSAFLAASLMLLVQIVWRHRHDTLLVAFALLPPIMLLLGTAVWSIQPVRYIYNPLDRSLLVIFLELQGGNAQLYATLATMALFFLATSRNLRWGALVISALTIGFGRVYLFDYHTGTVAIVAQWVYYLYILAPLAGVSYAWYRDWSQRQQVQFAL